ncbi:phage holin family protein [Novosphingobium sp. JCM 18896]|uniref:phage holin family protein n=1 Tax=Novosphingobium sp. JCM 18896 TaxID=2989731 RepID=UPI002222858C|nr:phage holin family protein [Novosphingobium sp. JCM 18896]MCW1428293.1 phage holin family protein [Novosphingobium sp. JCM 18896]
MSNEDEQPPLAGGEAARHRHLEDDLRLLVDRGLAFAKAEAALQQSRAGYAAGRIKWIALLGGLALVLAFFALVALTVGLVFGLTPILGALGATAAVFAGLLVAAGIAALIAAGQWRAMVAALSNRSDG